MDSGNYKFGANQRISLLCCPNFHASYPPMFLSGFLLYRTLVHGNRFFSLRLYIQTISKPYPKTITTPHPPHIVGNPVFLHTYHFSLNQQKTYHHGGSTPSCQALHPEQDVPACWEYAAHQDKESTPINSDHATSPMQPRHTPIPN